MKKLIILLLTIVSLIAVLPQEETYAEMTEILEAQNVIVEEKGEFRAAWLSNFISSMPNYQNETQWKTEVTKVLDTLEYFNFNAVIVHFRTHNNALYKSAINPRASFMAGVADWDVFDPMLWFVEESHRRGIEFHAWLNPYRVSSQYRVGSMPTANPESNASNVLNGAILNPGLPNVRQHIYDTIEEIIERYPVDAIHFDDYFYTNMGANGATSGATTILSEPDQATFVTYGAGYNTSSAASKADWRREQVNLLIEGIHDLLTDFNEVTGRRVQFGISPTGIYKNGNGVVTYDAQGKPITTGSVSTGQTHYASYLFADSLKWISEGWLDYILPQTYWGHTHPAAGYQNVMGWWDKVTKYLNVNLYSGIGVYMADGTGNYSWYNDPAEFTKQMNFLRTLENAQGFSVYRYNDLLNGKNGLTSNSAKQVRAAHESSWQTKTHLPVLQSFDPIIPNAVTNISHTSGNLKFDTQENAKFYYVYRSTGALNYSDEQIFKVVGNSSDAQITVPTGDAAGNYTYGVRAMSQTNHLGPTYQSSVPQPTINIAGTKVGLFYTSEVTITLSSALPIYYKLNSGEWQLYTAPVVVNSNGNHTFSYYAKGAEEDSNIASESFSVDRVNNVLPNITINGNVLPNGRYQVGSAVTITAASGQIWYKYNHGNQSIDWTLYTGPFTLDDATLVSGNYVIYAKTKDSGGVDSAEVQKTYQVGYAQPTLELVGEGEDPNYTWLEITINAQSPQPQFRINGGVWQNYTTPVDFAQSGTYKFEYRNANGDTIHSKEFTIVGLPAIPNYNIEGEMEGIYYVSPTILSFVAQAGNTIKYRMHNGVSWGSWTTYSEPLTFNYNGTFTIQYKAVNAGGIESEVEEVRIRMNMPYNEDNQYVIRDGQFVYYYNTQTPVELPTTYTEKDEEIRAVWVATVSNIDIGLHTSQADYKAKIISILNRLSALNFNTIFFQTRPMNDSFYPSEYAPFSRYLTGTEGVDPGWDVFEYLITEAHKRGIEVHAWMNPYRVSSGTGSKAEQLAQLSNDNFAKQNPSYVIQDTSGHLILNPGIPEVRQYLYNIIAELMANYDVDGVHFDDYFYSYNGTPNVEDEAAFLANNPNSLSRDNWRRENINELVKTIFEMVESHNSSNQKAVKFGISPFGIWQNKTSNPLGSNSQGLQSYSAQYADSRKWVKEGWLHYIIPQLYWQFNHSTARFADLVDWWVETVSGTDVKLIIGQGFYRYAETSNNWTDQNELLEQIRYMSQYEEIIGSSFFSYKTLNSPHAFVTQAITRLQNIFWTKRATFPWDTTVSEPQPIVNYTVTFNSNGGSNVAYQIVQEGMFAEEPIEPTKPGFNFEGWYIDQALTQRFDFDTPISSNITLYAKYEQEQEPVVEVTVSFNTNGGSEVESQTVPKDTHATRPTAPTKEGYDFVGWFKDEALTQEFSFGTAIFEDMTLYAKWQAKTVTPEPQPATGCWFLWDAPTFMLALLGAITMLGLGFIVFKKY